MAMNPTGPYNGNFKPLINSFDPQQKSLRQQIRTDVESGDKTDARALRKNLRSTYTSEQQQLSNTARTESGMHLIDWTPGTSGYLTPIGNQMTPTLA